MINPVINVFSENIYENWQVNEAKLIDIARKILTYYINTPEIYNKSCLYEQNYNTITFSCVWQIIFM